MSGRDAMAVRFADEEVAGCGETLSSVCLTFAAAFVRLAGGVIAGAKPAAIFNLPVRAYHQGCWRMLVRHELDEVLRVYRQVLPGYGVELAVLYRTERRVYLLAWRPDQLAEVLADPRCCAILREQGYVGTTCDELLAELRRRLVDYYRSGKGAADFPHEIGVFLGYPAEDVRGFMAGEQASCTGPWHAYGDPRVAERRFRALEAQERRCRTRYAAGEPLHALFAQ